MAPFRYATLEQIREDVAEAIPHAPQQVRIPSDFVGPIQATFITFTGPGYSYKVIYTIERLKQLQKAVAKAHKDATRIRGTTSRQVRHLAYGNSARGRADAARRLAADNY